MNAITQRIKIAEACPNLWKDRGFIWSETCFLVHPWDRVAIDPLDNLNVMHEALQALTDEQLVEVAEYLSVDFSEHPTKIAQRLFRATAAQLAAAFVRTLGLWEEGGQL